MTPFPQKLKTMTHGKIPGGRAFPCQPGVQILGSALALPEAIPWFDGSPRTAIANEDIFRQILGENFADVLQAQGMDPLYPEQVVGIKHRHWTHLIGTPPRHDEEHCVHLGVKAVQRLLTQLQLPPDAIDCLILASTTPHKTTSSSACAIAAELQSQAPCFDLKAGCSTGVYALLNAAMHVHAGFGRVLLVTAETPSKYANPKIQETVMGVGDGAVALLLGPGHPQQGPLGAFLGADGQLGQLVNTPGLLPPTAEAVAEGQYYYHGNSSALKEAVPLRYLDAMEGALQQAQLEASAIDWYIPHQVNRALTQQVAQTLGIPPEKQRYTLHQYGSMAGASVLATLHEGLHSGDLKSGQILALNTVGGGLTWSGLLWQL